jgi:prolyl oligopeptidase
MHRYTLIISLSLLAIVAATSDAQTQSPPLAYPAAARGTQVDDYHGVSIADPYRWLEDTDAPATKAWVEAENRLSDGFLAAIPERANIKYRLTQLWNYARYGAPFKEGGRYFYFENTGLQNQSVLFVQDRLNGPARVLLDPNVLSPDGTVALSGQAASSTPAEISPTP